MLFYQVRGKGDEGGRREVCTVYMFVEEGGVCVWGKRRKRERQSNSQLIICDLILEKGLFREDGSMNQFIMTVSNILSTYSLST